LFLEINHSKILLRNYCKNL